MNLSTRINLAPALACFVVVCANVALVPVANAEEKKPPKVTYDEHVKPILQQKCFSCHNQDKKSSDLDLTSYSALMQGGASGEAVIPGDSAASYLYELVTHASEPIMPPESPKIPDAMIETLRKWIDGGVLENAGSKAIVSKKKTFDMALSAPSTERPAVVPLPGRLSLQPYSQPKSVTAINAIATSPWAPLAAVSGHKEILLYNTSNMAFLGSLPFPEGNPRVLKFSRNGSLLLAGGGIGGQSGRVVVWNIRNGERIIEIGSELDEVLAADISSDQTLIALGGPQRVVRIYSTETGSLMHEIRKHTDWVTSLEFSPDSVLLATGDRNGGLFVWEGWTGREYLTLKGHTKGITGISWRSDSNIVASCSEDTTVRLWEMNNGGQVKNWGAHGGGASSIEFTRNGSLLTCGRDKVAKLWDQAGKQQRAFEAFSDLALAVSFCDETNRGIAGDWNGEIRVWDAANGNRLGTLAMKAPTLQQRLDESTKLVQTREAGYKPIETAFKTTQAAMLKMKADFAAAQKLAATTKAESDAATTKLNNAKTALTKATTEHQAVKTQVDTMTKGVPMLADAAQRAVAAAAQLPGDADLVATAKKLQDTARAKQATLANLQKALAVKLTALQTTQQTVTQTQKLVTDLAAKLKTANAEQARLMPLVKPAEDKALAAKQTYDKATAELTSARQLVSRWTDEIAFSQRLAELNKQRSEVSKMLGEHQQKHVELSQAWTTAVANLTKATDQLKATTQNVETYKKNYQLALTEIEKAKQAQVVATTAKNQSAANVMRLGQIIAKLNESFVKANEAVAIAAGDAQVAGAANAVKVAVDARNKSFVEAKNDLAAKTKAEQDAAQALVAKQKSAADTLAAAQAAEKQIPVINAMLAPLQTTVNQAKTVVDAAQAAVAQAQAKLDEVQQAIAKAQGLTSA